MKSATTASTEMPQPAIAIPVCPVGTNSLFHPRRRASRSSSSDTVIFPIAQSEPTVRIVVASMRQVRAGRNVEPRRRQAQVAQVGPVLAGERDKLRIGRDELVQTVLDVEPVADAVLQELAPRRGEPSALRRDADERRRRLVTPRPDRRCARAGTLPARSRSTRESRTATTSSGRYRSTPRAVFP